MQIKPGNDPDQVSLQKIDCEVLSSLPRSNFEVSGKNDPFNTEEKVRNE